MRTTIAAYMGETWPDGFGETTGLNGLEADGEGGFTMVAEVAQHMLNPNGAVHGGVYFTLCDNAAGALMHAMDHRSVTMQSDLSFYRAAYLGDTLYARPSLRKFGQTVSVVWVELTNQKGERLADGSFQMFWKEK